MLTDDIEVDWEWIIYNELANKRLRQADIAQTYSYLIRSGFKDWENLNKAIINRWSKAGLRRVKNMAWKFIQGGE